MSVIDKMDIENTLKQSKLKIITCQLTRSAGKHVRESRLFSVALLHDWMKKYKRFKANRVT